MTIEEREAHTLELAKIECPICWRQGKPEYDYDDTGWCHISRKDTEAVIFCCAHEIWDAHKQHEYNIINPEVKLIRDNSKYGQTNK